MYLFTKHSFRSITETDNSLHKKQCVAFRLKILLKDHFHTLYAERHFLQSQRVENKLGLRDQVYCVKCRFKQPLMLSAISATKSLSFNIIMYSQLNIAIVYCNLLQPSTHNPTTTLINIYKAALFTYVVGRRRAPHPTALVSLLISGKRNFFSLIHARRLRPIVYVPHTSSVQVGWW